MNLLQRYSKLKKLNQEPDLSGDRYLEHIDYITLTVDQLKDFCEAFGWTPASPLTKQKFLNKVLREYIGNVVKGQRLRGLEKTQRIDLKNLADSTTTEVGGIVVT